MASIIIAAEGAHELRKLGERIKEAGRDDLRRKMRKNIRKAGQPVIADLRRAVMGVNVTRSLDTYSRRWEGGAGGRFVFREDLKPPREGRWGRRSTGLRARTARALTLSQTRKGVRIQVSARKFGDYGVTLPRYLDTEASPRWKRWRHPVFGNQDVWVEQRGEPWFFVTFSKHKTRFINAVDDAIDELIRELER